MLSEPDHRDPLDSEICVVAIKSLQPAHSPRLAGEDSEHIHRLAETDAPLPPILVHRPTMRVIDGMHRLRAAQLGGRDEIEVRFFDGGEDEAFIYAVELNVQHGLPLTLAERKAAAVRIVSSHPRLSDRTIAARTGLSASTVGAVRRRSTVDSAHSNARIGADGRQRPLPGSEGRLRAAEMIAARPGAPLREIAKSAGVSVGTAHDVRGRIDRGEDPVPPGRNGAGARARNPARGPAGDSDGLSLLHSLMKDPSMRQTELGRRTLRLLGLHAATAADWSAMADAVPPHCVHAVAELAQQYAEGLGRFARELERRRRVLK